MPKLPQMPFQIESHDGADKSFAIMGPDGFNMIIDYDDVDHELQDRMAQKVTRLLNTFWDGDEET